MPRSNHSNYSYNCRIVPILLLALMLIITIPLSSPAANPLEKLSDIQKAIKSTMEEAQKTKEKENSVRSNIDNINQSIRKKEDELNSYDKNIVKTRSEMEILSQEISMLSRKLDARKKYLRERIRSLYKRQYGGDALVLISARDYQDLTQRSKYISLLAHYDSKILNKYSDDLMIINAKKRELDSMNNKLLASKQSALKKKESLQSERKRKDETLKKIKSIRLAKEAKIRELEESSKQLQQMIKKLDNKQIPQSILGKGFASLKGSLPWPVQGGSIDSRTEQEESVDAAPERSDGIYIIGGADGIAKSVAGGRVVYASSFKGYGMLVIVDHGSGYHSLYGNLHDFSIEDGDLVVEGMDIGTITTTKDGGNVSLYFEIRHKGKPVDPSDWLKKQSLMHGGYAAER